MKLVVLTKSAKRRNDRITYGNCVAGINELGEWVRLVSDYDGDSLLDSTCRPFSCLDIIDVDVTPCPIEHHPENVKLERFNGVIGSCSIDDVVERFNTDTERMCFINKYSSLTENERHQAEKSLMLILVQDFVVYKDDRGKYKAKYIYNGLQYEDIGITDNRYKRLIEFDEAYIVVSLPNETVGHARYYKFIAAVYPV